MTAHGSIAFFGHNANEAAVRRRATAFMRTGWEVYGFMPRRGDHWETEWRNIDLGETRDNDYGQRLRAIVTGARIAAKHADALKRADVIYARNLDMLATAYLARRRLRLKTPLVYECLDVHHRLTGKSVTARILRMLERHLVRVSSLIVVSSPRFETEHFRKYYPGMYRCHLLENRLPEGDNLAARPTAVKPKRSGPLRLGWFGNLRCRRSLDHLSAAADHFDGSLQVVLRGYPAPGVFKDFDAKVSMHPNIEWHGRYQSPEDLPGIYGDVDLIWAGDWYEEGANSRWLLPNRIYEGGYFRTPAIAPAGTETSRWLTERGGGFVIEEPTGENLIALCADLIRDLGPIKSKEAHLASLPRDVFVEGPDALHALVKDAVA